MEPQSDIIKKLTLCSLKNYRKYRIFISDISTVKTVSVTAE